MVMKNKIIMFTSLILITLFSLSVFADWEQSGADEFNTRNQPLFNGYFTPDNNSNIVLSVTQESNFISTIKPLADDFDGDGLEEIFVYDASNGNIGVYNINTNYNIILRDTYNVGTTVTYDPAITSFTVAEGGDKLFVIRNNESIFIFTYENSQLNLYWNVSTNGTLYESNTFCTGQDINLAPNCYWLNENGQIDHVFITKIAQPILANSSVMIAPIDIISGITLASTDLDSDGIKSIVFNYQDDNEVDGIQHHFIRFDGINYTVYQDVKFGNPCASNSGTNIIKMVTSPNTFCYVGGYSGFSTCKGRSLVRCYNSSDGSEANINEMYAVSTGTSTISNFYYADMYFNDFDNDGFNEYMLIGSADDQKSVYRIFDPITAVGTANKLASNRIDDGVTGALVVDDAVTIISSDIAFSLDANDSFDNYSLSSSVVSDSIVSDFNNNGFNDIVGMDSSNGLTFYFNSVLPPTPTEEVITFVPNNQYSGFYGFWGSASTCAGREFTFKANRCLSSTSDQSDCSYIYDGLERQRIVANIDGQLYYGDWTYSAGEFTLELDTTLNLQGSYNVVLYLQTEDKPSDFSVNSGQFIINVNGDQVGINCNLPDTFLDAPTPNSAKDSKNKGLDGIFDTLLGNNPKTKFIIGAGIVIGLIVLIVAEYKIHNPIVLLLIFIMGVAICTMLGLFPAWIIILFIIIAVLIMLFKNTLSGNNNGD